MRWSKVKQLAEANFSPDLGGRVKLNLTRIRATHDAEQRGTINVDGEVWLNACFFNHAIEFFKQNKNSWNYNPGLDSQLDQQGLIPGWEFPREVFDYLNVSVDDALSSGKTVKTILAVLDRRVGKRRFREIAETFKDHPVVARFVQLRMDVSEGNRPAIHQQPQLNT